MIVSSTHRITGLNYTYGCPNLSAANNCNLDLTKHSVTPLEYLNTLPTELLGYTTLTDVQP